MLLLFCGCRCWRAAESVAGGEKLGGRGSSTKLGVEAELLSWRLTSGGLLIFNHGPLPWEVGTPTEVPETFRGRRR